MPYFLEPKTYNPKPSPRSGFTIIELLLFSAIFVLVSVGFTSVFLSIVRSHTRQAALVDINRESQFVVEKIQKYVAQASYIDAEQGITASTLRLRMPDAARDPVIISKQGSAIYVQEGSTPATPITSSKVSVSSLSLIKQVNAGARDSVNILFTMSTVSSNPLTQLAIDAQTTVSRVSAATFDSNLVPSSGDSLDVGVSGQLWRSINNLIYFSGSNVGVGTTGPQDTLEVNGRLRVTGADAYITNPASGVVLKSAGGTCARVYVTNTGVVTSTVIACP